MSERVCVYVCVHARNVCTLFTMHTCVETEEDLLCHSLPQSPYTRYLRELGVSFSHLVR